MTEFQAFLKCLILRAFYQMPKISSSFSKGMKYNKLPFSVLSKLYRYEIQN